MQFTRSIAPDVISKSHEPGHVFLVNTRENITGIQPFSLTVINSETGGGFDS